MNRRGILFSSILLALPLAQAATVPAAFTSATIEPVVSYGYTATGKDLDLSLGFAPPRGTTLTVVNNAGNSFISGSFSNLAQGQVVNLAYSGVTYRFVADYFGGTGNDLVLHWGFQTACTWGLNMFGQLGNNSTTQSRLPVAVLTSGPLSGKIVVAVAGGANHSLALCSDGTLASWGGNSAGQLGNNSTTDSSVPVAIPRTGILTFKTVIAIAAGRNHSLALCSDGTMAAWGANDKGQLGGFALLYSSVPIAVTQTGVLSGKTVVAIAAGEFHSLARCSDGTLASWGDNNYGQLGNGSSAPSSAPALIDRSGVLSGRTVTSLAAGYSHSLALCSDGALASWGSNGSGQLGIGTTGQGSNAPVLVSRTGGLSGKTVTALAGGLNHSLTAHANSTAAAWGTNVYGQLGNGSVTSSSLAVAVTNSGTFSDKKLMAAAAGANHNLLLCSDGALFSWGYNNYGQLGDNSSTSSPTPVVITTRGSLSGKTPVAVAAGASHSLAVAASPVSNPTNESSLVKLTTTAGLLNPSFTSGHPAYAATVPTTTTSVTVTPTVAMPTATVKVNGTTVTSGNASAAVPLAYGSNTITIVGKAPDGVTTTTYTLTVTRIAPSTVCTLASLVLSDGILSPVFTSATAVYFTRVSHDLSSITVTPTITDSNSSITVNGSPLVSGTASPPIALAVGVNTLSIRVTAGDGTTTKTYTVAVIRERSPASLLSGLALNTGNMSPAFRPAVLAYSASVTASVSSITVTPTSADPAAVVTVNGSVVVSGTVSPPVALTEGNTTLIIRVTAPDMTFTDYVVNVIRPSSLNFTYTSAADIPAGFAAYDATGLTATLSLGFAPPLGCQLTVINNTGIDFIRGRFLNIAHGQNVNLVYQGVTWRFVANYHGGTGNDLVLQWANQSISSWGYNSSGELGNNSTANSPVPVDVSVTAALQNKSIVAVAAGGGHNLALCSDGSMASWGANSLGQLGTGNTAARGIPGPVTISAALTGKTVVAVACNYFSLALCSDGTVTTWGSGSSGQLGNGNTVNSNLPVKVNNTGVLAEKTVVAAATGGAHGLALCSDGTLAAWGSNSSGQLGNNSTANSDVPVAVDSSGILADKTVVAIAAGSYYNLALCSDGSLVSWGNNSHGQLGNGGTTTSKVPTLVDRSGVLAGKTITSLATNSSSMALCSDGTVATWGSNYQGMLGNGDTVNSPQPVAVNASGVLSGRKVVRIAAGYTHSAAQCGDGSIVAWGSGNNGSLGNGGTDPSSVPVMVDATGVLAAKAVSSVSAKGSHNLALTALPVAIPATDYESWLLDHPAVPDPSSTADPDRDGIPNLIEFVLNSDPGKASTTSLPGVSTAADSLVFSFIRRHDSALETSQFFQFGNDMVDWENVNITEPTDPKVTLGAVDGQGNQTVTVTIPKASQTRIFGRLLVTRP